MPQYAANTSVSMETSIQDIKRTLNRYGADAFLYGESQNQAMVQFRVYERVVKFVLDMPRQDDEQFWTTPTGRDRKPEAAFKEWEQSNKQRWRALLLVIKAKLEAVEAGITEFEDEFMAHIVLPDGRTVSEVVRPEIAMAYETGQMPALTMGGEG